VGTLWKETGRPLLPRALVLAATLAFAVGLTLPVVTFRTGLVRDSYSVLGGIVDLAREGDVALAGIVLAFSVIFPVVKLALLQHALHGPLTGERRARLVHALERLGRWSMLDVFVIAILIGAMHLGILSEAYAEPGIYVFAGGILLAMLATRAVQGLLRERVAERRIPPATALERWGSVLALALFAAGLFLPLIVVEKFRFFDREYSVLDASRRMLEEGEHGLAAAVLFFVVALPLARLVGLVLLRFSRRPERLARPILALEEWAMLDVFGLALLVVVAKLGSVATVEIRAGFWLLLVAAALSLRDSVALRRA
jgi:paraquat-inducible protein A